MAPFSKVFKDNVKRWNLIIEQYDYDEKTWTEAPQTQILRHIEEAVKDDASYYFSYFVFYFSVDPTLWSGLNPKSVSSDIRIELNRCNVIDSESWELRSLSCSDAPNVWSSNEFSGFF